MVGGAHKTLRFKTKLGKKQKQNRTLPYWVRQRTDNKIRYNAKRPDHKKPASCPIIEQMIEIGWGLK
ncbi:unnamed protein product [Rodentolepis nana]|uniref:Large ribosomal subunit protein eL39 n=1 Tax=Rodentolepis nana TaxID=102285 RepID=A0A0R3TUP0_RODNA|nr:unnamed protein product [Rodentolepis nana]